jgi:predicted HicB family RNase H-like nuclease
MLKKDIHTTVFQLAPKLHRELKLAAVENNISMGEAIRRAIELWLKQQKKPKRRSGE